MNLVTSLVCHIPIADHPESDFKHTGLYHEHQRPLREDTVRYQCQNVDPGCPDGKSMPPGKTCCDSGLPDGCCRMVGNFDIFTTGDSSGPYDIDSIMQYTANAFAIGMTQTLISADPSRITVPTWGKSNPSARDFERICKLYSGQCPKAISCRAAGCPAFCTSIKSCVGSFLCTAVKNPPKCCDPKYIVVDDCMLRSERCDSLGCKSLFQ